MLFPIGDDNRDQHITPVVNYILIALNIFVFLFFQKFGQDYFFTYAYSTVPAEIITGQDIITDPKTFYDPNSGNNIQVPGLQPTPVSVYLTLLTSMFMHGGIAHIAGNMLYLWIFGDNLENALGHRRYLIFYLLCGVLASLSHVYSSSLLNKSMLVPSLGASGAISGVLGGYLLLFPGRGVLVWTLLGVVSLPAILVVGLWFIFQLVSGFSMLNGSDAGGGVAYAAHIGGFVAGLVLVNFFKTRTINEPAK
jgi:membrane associated rhomboid family serine protease